MAVIKGTSTCKVRVGSNSDLQLLDLDGNFIPGVVKITVVSELGAPALATIEMIVDLVRVEDEAR